MPKPDISIIVPTLNEAQNIPLLLESLRQQLNCQFELIIVDGGSSDATRTLLTEFQKQHGLNTKIITTQTGRAIQMNCGASAAMSKELLFLHADTYFENPSFLCTGLTYLKSLRDKLGHDHVAGHYGLHFRRRQTTPSLAYYFYESKTRLNRMDTINGDQGFMLSKAFFDALGGFDESLNYMEDARLARKIHSKGQWVTLPGTLSTSARRFETEGLKQRQILNAFLCNFDHIGLTEFFTVAASAYRAQSKTGALALKPFFLLIHSLVIRQGFFRAAKLWYKTGTYVANNAWQLAFALDCRKNHRDNLSPEQGPTPKLIFYDCWLKPLVDSPPGHLITAVLTFIWFYSALLMMVLRK
ncbi:MAG: hypothetical protein AMJ53_09305 [Gammaproteobacteria bacterium SG8_11]|nr:MAG: hypothetical protein AMJ53_09305 [Gammaproteobacteria bacterium SG8_11]